ncbi:MMPL family transporter [Rothia sp. LK2588]|uniref:MMPL family transporter n=1 Tax=Rothia sp. LK2588 TaxID=3114369 RepID=UPI0034CD8CC1
MSQFLYRVGSFAARKAWVVITIWVLILAGLAGAFTAFKGELSDTITIPGTQAQQLQETISQKFDSNLSAATGMVVLETADGKPFTDQQKKDVASVVKQVEGIGQVEQVLDPFATADKISSGREELKKNQGKIDEGYKQLEGGQQKVDDAAKQIEPNQKKLDETQAAIDSGQIPEAGRARAQAEVDAGRQQLAPALQQLEQGRKDLAENRKKLEDGQAEIDRNTKLLDLSSDASMISADGSAAVVTVRYNSDIGSIEQGNLDSTREKFNALDGKNMKVLTDRNLEGMAPHMGVTGETIGIIVALIVLFVMMGTLIAAGLPIIMAIVGLGAAMLGTFALSNVVEMNSTTPALGSMLGLAVGIDYTLFILNRHRNNLATGLDIKKSIALATGTSGGAVVFAGSTVIIALLALNVVGIPFLAVMGNVAAFAVLMAVAVSVTLSPAILSLAGRRVVPKKRWEAIQRRNADRAAAHRRQLAAQGGHASRADEIEAEIDQQITADAHRAAQEREETPRGWLKMVLAKPVLTILAAVAVLGLIAFPMTQMRLGLPTGASQHADSAAYQSYMAIKDNFGDGQNGPVIVAANLPEGTTETQAKDLQVSVGQELKKQENVEKVIPAMISKDNQMLLYQVIPTEGPSTVSTENLVHNVRSLKTNTAQGEVTYGVTGQTAMNIDISANLAEALPIYVAVVVGLSLIVLILVFRSIWVPLTATIGFLFSLGAAFGATIAVFQWGWLGSLFGVTTPEPILSFLPVLVVGILFGLAMDYQVFLVSAMREAYAHGRDGKTSVKVGFNHSAKVVVAAALIMMGVFLGFVFSGDPMISSIGFALAAGVFFDAFLVRMMLIPALMHLLGDRAWKLPRWLDKLLPDLDIEGTQLEREVTHQ